MGFTMYQDSDRGKLRRMPEAPRNDVEVPGRCS